MLKERPKRILITRLRFIGDVVLTTPVIRAIRRAYPQAEIIYLAEAEPASILEHDPDLNGIIVLDRDHISTLPMGQQWREFFHLFRRIRAYRFDLVIDLFCNPRSALLTLLSGARYRLGYDVRGRGWVYNLKIKRLASIRVLDAYLDAVRTLGISGEDDRTNISISCAEATWASTYLADCFGSDDKPVIGINPGASWPAKMWGSDQFGNLINRLVSGYGAHILIIQGPGQEKIIEAVRGEIRHRHEIVKTTSLMRLAALMHQCALFISNDCGPMHMAVAVGTPTIGLFGPSRSDIWFPYRQEEGHLPLRPDIKDCCGKDVCIQSSPCIRQIPVDDVFKAAGLLLSNGI